MIECEWRVSNVKSLLSNLDLNGGTSRISGFSNFSNSMLDQAPQIIQQPDAYSKLIRIKDVRINLEPDTSKELIGNAGNYIAVYSGSAN